MSNVLTVVLTIFIVAQFQGIKCNPLHVEKEIGSVPRIVRVFKPDKKEWMHFHHSWGLPHFPSLTSVSNFFQDEDEKDRIATKNRLEVLEKNQKEILTILQKLNDEIVTKKNQTKPQSLDEEPQTSILDDKKPTPQSPNDKEVTTKKMEIENFSSTIPLTIPSIVSTTITSTVLSSVSSTDSSTTVTREPAIETSTVQVTTQQPQSSTSLEESQPQTPDQNENANSNSNSNTPDNQAVADSAGQQSSPPTDTNSGSIVAFSSDEREKVTEIAQSTA